jgi:hypothetical protein
MIQGGNNTSSINLLALKHLGGQIQTEEIIRCDTFLACQTMKTDG